jgi:hypothetical protein
MRVDAAGPVLDAAVKAAAAAAMDHSAPLHQDPLRGGFGSFSAATPGVTTAGANAFGGMGGVGGGVQAPGAKNAADAAVATGVLAVIETVRMAWALTAVELGRPEADAVVAASSDAGALVALRAVIQAGCFQDDGDASRRAYLELTHLTLRRAIGNMLKNPVIGEALAAVVPAPTPAQIAQQEREANGLGGLDGLEGQLGGSYDGYGGQQAHFEQQQQEERARRQREEEENQREAPLTALCGLLSEVYRQAPDLPAAAVDCLPGFLDAVVEWEHSVESLVGVIGLLAAIAGTGTAGAQSVWHRMQAPLQGAAITWDNFLGALVGYNRRFAYGGDSPADLAAGVEREMPEADIQGLCAYLGLLSALMTRASPAEGAQWVVWLEGRYGVLLLDGLMRLHANPVPSRLKASLLEAVGAVGGGSAAAAADLWARLEAEMVLQPQAPGALGGPGGGAGSNGAYGGGINNNGRAMGYGPGGGGGQAGMMGSGGGYGSGMGGGGMMQGPAGAGMMYGQGGGGQYGGGQQGMGGYGVGGGGGRQFGAGMMGGGGGYGAAAAARQQQSYAMQQTQQQQQQLMLQNQLAIPGADISYEFNNLEAQSQTYPHAVAYVGLVNKLLRVAAPSRVGPAASAGRASSPQFRFVRDQVFGNLRRRQHRCQEERWSLARDAVEHFRLQLQVYRDADPADKAVSRPAAAAAAAAAAAKAAAAAAAVQGRQLTPQQQQMQQQRAAAAAAANASVLPPGYDLMIDFLSDGPTLKGLLAVLSVGADRLAAERGTAHGEALEAAVLGSLEVLVTALSMDAHMVADLRERATSSGTNPGSSAPGGGGSNGGVDGGVMMIESSNVFHNTLDTVMLRDLHQCAAVLGYVQYRYNPALPLAALKILAVLSDRVERLVDLLPIPAAAALVEGAASCLELAVLPGVGAGGGGGGGGSAGSGNGGSGASSSAAAAAAEAQVSEAGALVLDLLLDNLTRRAPSIAHLLLGYDVTRDVECAHLDPFCEFNCLTVLLELLEACPPSFAAAGGASGGARGGSGGGGGEAPEAAARLLFELAAHPRTAPAALGLLQQWPPGAPPGQQRLPLLLADALAAAPPQQASRRAAAAHYRAWIVRLAALVLDAVAPPVGAFPAASVSDLPPLAAAITQAALFRGGSRGPDYYGDDGDGMGGVEQPRLAALELLATLPAPPLQPLAAAAAVAAGGGGLSHDAAQLQGELRVAELLSDRRPVEAGGCLEVTTRGDAVISIRALGARLLEESRRVSAAQQGLLGGGGFGGGGGGGAGGMGSGGDPAAAAAAARLRDVHKEAVQSAVRQARAFNSSVEEHAAHVHIVSAWSELMALTAGAVQAECS